MKRFPQSVREAMQSSGAMATCLPVQIDGSESDWETAFFLQIAGPESKQDRRTLRAPGKAFSVGIEPDVIETESGAVVIIRAEIHTRVDDPLSMEILLTPGEGGAHHEALKLLTQQHSLTWFFGDQAYWLIHAQSQPLGNEHREGFLELLNSAVKYDALVRMTGHYDSQAALSELVKSYELRAANGRSNTEH